MATVLDRINRADGILVAEDNEFSARLMKQWLARRGHRVWLTSNDSEAFACLHPLPNVASTVAVTRFV